MSKPEYTGKHRGSEKQAPAVPYTGKHRSPFVPIENKAKGGV